jgi:DNA repair protein RecN (Recombination protein N)
MLRFLRIEHLAVIDELQLDFEPGLNVLTGETGAGKSMLVEALGLLTGGRASADLIRTGESQASVQAIFDTPAGELIVRRDITAQGRSRALINDGLVTAAALADRTSPLVELHGQHEHQALLDPQRHLAMLDDFAALVPLRQEVAAAFVEWKRAQSALDALQLDERERAARIDLLSFQAAELDRARLRANEDDELETTRRVLASADRLQRVSGDAYAALYESDEAVLGKLSTVWKRVGELAEIDPAFLSHLDSRDGIKAQLEELAAALREFGNGIDASPSRLQEVEDRLALIERLKRKYGPLLGDVIRRRDQVVAELDLLHHSDARRTDLERQAANARTAFLERARELSERRRTAAVDFSRGIQRLLEELAMGRTDFDLRFDADLPDSAWSENGIDAAEWYLSANVGEDPRPLARIASGGELSRVMLAIRTLATAETPGKTLIFDEIDAGIGGRIADEVGRKLRRLGDTFQVLCITHLPQIAGAAHVHFHISKRVMKGRTQTRITRLDEEGRIDELARMIGGAGVTAAARAAARELLAKGEIKTKGESERRPRTS